MAEQAPDSSPGPVLSVRGFARREVEPDVAELTCLLRVIRGSKAEALSGAAAQLDALTRDLRALGGRHRTTSTASHPLTWLARPATTELEQGHNAVTGQSGPTGRVIAHLVLVLTVRQFPLLERLGRALAKHETVNVIQTVWQVDVDNPQWRQVRADAVHAAVRQARDYAAALGGSLRSIDHLADVGLLSSSTGETARASARAVGFTASGGPPGDPDVPRFDPEPQPLTATIEARFTTSDVDPVVLATNPDT